MSAERSRVPSVAERHPALRPERDAVGVLSGHIDDALADCSTADLEGRNLPPEVYEALLQWADLHVRAREAWTRQANRDWNSDVQGGFGYQPPGDEWERG